MIKFVLTVDGDEGKDEDVVEQVDLIISDAFDSFVDGIMQDYPKTEYSSSVD